MLRPERMSRVSVTGSKAVMAETVETVHDLNLFDVSDYDGAWEGFDPGDPMDGADDASNKLITVRSLQSILGVEAEDAGPNRLVTDEALDTELEDIRREVNDLDDERDDLESELGDVEERIDTFEPFAKLGIDMDLLTGYDSLAVGVGEGDAGAIRSELEASDAVEAFEVFAEEDAVAVYVYPAGDAEDVSVSDLLVGARFQASDIPEAEGSPEEYLSELRHRKQQLESKLDTVEDELEDVRLEVAGFLLAAEEKLAIEVQKSEAPLNFATTENAFVAEGWLPTDEFDRLESALAESVGDHVDVEELERAAYDSDGHVTDRERVEGGGASGTDADAETESAAAEDAGAGEDQQAVADGGLVTMSSGDPPVIQDNPLPSRPFEVLVGVINRPKYTEFDPTLFVFLSFPLFFGLMIGDVGYGAAYLVVGYLLYSRSDSDALASLGAIAVWSGAFSIVFGFLAGEIFGLETITKVVWNGSPIIHKGIRPAFTEWAKLWLALSVVLGLIHVNLGHVLAFFKNLSHGVWDAVTESGSWVLMTVGVWLWVFSLQAQSYKPEFLFTAFDGNPVPLGFGGFSPAVGYVGLAALVVGFVLLFVGAPIEVAEVLQVLVNILSYTRLAAEVLAEAGIAFVVNLLFFGAYSEGGEFHLLVSEGPAHVRELHEATLMFPGLLHMGIVGILFGLVVLVFGHVLVLAIGVLSAGMQAVRLEYVEFFGKFYEGGGRAFRPFGYEREYTAED
ncbi:MAG: V-type ATP synthase subunit I [Halanaeroarchaeum sp.]